MLMGCDLFILLCYLPRKVLKLYFFSLDNFQSQEAVKLKPAFPDAYLNLGNVYKVSCHA